MSVINNNSPDNVINRLINVDAQAMKGSVQLRRTGPFKSRTITVGDQECSLKQLITELGKKIKQADVKQDEPNLEKLKEMLTAVSAAEKANRSGTASLFHFFSSRDKDVAKLEKTVDVKIKEHRAFKALEGGVEVVLKDITAKFRNLLTGLYAGGKPIKDDVHETMSIYIDINEENPSYSFLKDDNKLNVQFYMSVNGVTGTAPSYRMALKDDTGLTTQEVLDYLIRIG